MASGAQHYRDAERAFENAKDAKEGSEMERWQMFAADFHARMALTAATALRENGRVPIVELEAWRDVCATGTPTAGQVADTEGTCPGGC